MAANLESVLKSCDLNGGNATFWKNRPKYSGKIDSMTPLYDAPMTQEERDSEHQKEIKDYNTGLRLKFKEESELINYVGRDVWDSSRNKFRNGDAYSMKFMDDEEETVRKNRFSDKINFNSSYNQVRAKRRQKEEMISNINRDLNVLESQHIEYNTCIGDRATKEVIKERRTNIYADNNTDKEIGNKDKLTKLHSAEANRDILEKLSTDEKKLYVGPVRLRMHTTIISDIDGDQIERDEILSDKNMKFTDADRDGDAQYKEEITNYKS